MFASIPGIDTFLVITRIYVGVSYSVLQSASGNVSMEHLYPGLWVTVLYGAIACLIATLVIYVPIWIAVAIAKFVERSKWHGEKLMSLIVWIHKIYCLAIMPNIGVLAGLLPFLMYTQYVFFTAFTANKTGL